MGKLILILIIVMLTMACNSERSISDEVVATVNGESILMSDIDAISRQQIFEELYRIHLIREITLNKKIEDKLIEIEAFKKKKNANEFVKQYVENKFTKENYDRFIKENGILEKGVYRFRDNLEVLDPKSKEGQNVLKSNFKNYIISILIDSLKGASVISVNLKKPSPPKIDISLFDVKFKNYKSGNVTVIIVTDPDCINCKESQNLVDKIEKIYGNKVNVGITQFSTIPTISGKALEISNKYNKFWPFYNKLMQITGVAKEADVLKIVEELGLNPQKFLDDLSSVELEEKMKKNFEHVRDQGIFGVPTYIIDGDVLFNTRSEELVMEIEKRIKNNS